MKEELSEDLQIYQRIHEAFKNSYDVIINNKDPYRYIQLEGDVVYAHDIEAPLDIESIQHMISYWEDFEEYEMCAKLKHLENEITRLSARDKRPSSKYSYTP